ncbi:MAG: hypothetical protein AAFQ61_05525 [Cyanobacteria bacterium J06626_23]
MRGWILVGALAMLPVEQAAAQLGDVGGAIAPPILTAAETALTSYTAASFSIQYPQDWQAQALGEDDIEIVSGDPTMDIHTQLRLLREDPADVVSQYIEQLLADDALVLLYRTVSVDGRSGFRVWLGEQPDPRTGVPKSSLVTFVGYGTQQTVQIVSYYDTETAEAALLEMHDSFTHLAPPDLTESE